MALSSFQIPASEARDAGYDTDSIAIFEIDKSFTDFLLCQICFSKYFKYVQQMQK